MGVTKCYKGLQRVTRGKNGLQIVTGAFKGYRGLERVTRALQRVT